MAKKKVATARKKTAVKKTAATKKTAAVKKKTAPKKKTGVKRKSVLSQTSYNVSPELQAVIGTGKQTRPQIVKKLWAYIKAKKCQDANNRRMIVPDAKLAAVIGKKPVDMLKLAGFLNKHIQS